MKRSDEWKKVAVVTGANKGIGFQVVKLLCTRFDGDVILCSRDEERGKSALSKLKHLGLKPLFFKLDIGEKDDVERLQEKLESEYGGIDILINNAAVNFVPKGDRTADDNIELQVSTMVINYFATAHLCDTLLPIVKTGGRVINVSSLAGLLNFFKNKTFTARVNSGHLTRETLDSIAREYIDDLKNRRDHVKGWPVAGYAYFTSKILVTALTWIQQEQMAKQNVSVVAVHPGYVRTDMSRNMGHLTQEEGARSIIFAALQADTHSDYRRKIIFPSTEAKDWLARDALDGMNVDQIVEMMVDWVEKVSKEP